MSLVRNLVLCLCLVMLCAAAPAWAQVGCVPNPNLAGPPSLVDGCPYPAAGLNKAQLSIINVVTSCGAVGNDIVDDTVAIQTCINNLPIQGGYVWFPAQYTFKTTAPIVIGNGTSSTWSTRAGVMLVGGGNPVSLDAQGGGLITGGPIIDYQGSADAITISGPLMGWGVSGLIIRCAVASGTNGLHVISGQYGESRDLFIHGCGTELSSGTIPNRLTTNGSTTDAFHNNYKNMVLQLETGDTVGMILDGSTSGVADTDFNEITNITIMFELSGPGPIYGIILRVCDDNHITNVHFTARGTVPLIRPYYFDYTVQPNFPASNVIDTTDPAFWGCIGSGNPPAPGSHPCGNQDAGVNGSNFTNNGTPNNSTANFLSHLDLANTATYPLDLPNLIIDHGYTGFTPVLAGSTGGVASGCALQAGAVTENGWTVTIFYQILTCSVGTMTGNLLMTGLPVHVGSQFSENIVCSSSFNGVTLSSGNFSTFFTPQANVTQGAFAQSTGGVSTLLPVSAIGGGTVSVNGECSYHR